jgi:hypothetical protein
MLANSSPVTSRSSTTHVATQSATLRCAYAAVLHANQVPFPVIYRFQAGTTMPRSPYIFYFPEREREFYVLAF